MIDGVKQFITSGKNGQVAIVIAVTDKGAGKRGMSAFLVPTDAPGYNVARLEDKLGQHSSDTAQINFDGCRIPAENLIGAEGEGYKIALGALEGGRIGIAAQSVGMARSAFDVGTGLRQGAPGLRRIDLRPAGGRLPPRRMRDAARSRAPAHLARRRPARRRPALPEGSRDGQALRQRDGRDRSAVAAIQTLGGYGYVNDFPLECIYRDARVCQIYEGTSDIQKLLIQRALA